MYARIAGVGSYLPGSPVSNDDLAQRGVDTTDEWIVSRTGIRTRHLAEPGVTSSELALEASRRALEDAGIDATELDLIIVATSTPDFIFPSTACLLQGKLGNIGAMAFDIQAVCAVPAIHKLRQHFSQLIHNSALPFPAFHKCLSQISVLPAGLLHPGAA